MAFRMVILLYVFAKILIRLFSVDFGFNILIHSADIIQVRASNLAVSFPFSPPSRRIPAFFIGRTKRLLIF